MENASLYTIICSMKLPLFDNIYVQSAFSDCLEHWWNNYMSHLMRLWQFLSSVNSIFKCGTSCLTFGLMTSSTSICVRTAKAPARLHGCTGSPTPSLVAYVISTIISWAGSYCQREASVWPSGLRSRLRFTGSQVRIPLEARFFPNLNGTSLHRAFHVHPSIVLKWLKYCWRDVKP